MAVSEFWAWALPGMRLKRWILLALAGIALLNAAAGMAMYEFFKPHANLVFWALGAMSVGMVALVIGSHRVISEVVEVVGPTTNLREAMVRSRGRRRGPKIVAIGGGTGLSTLLRGLKHHSDNLTAIVTVADDGGSSGRLREELGVLPPGDIRNCLIALAGEERLLTELFRFRFPGETGLGGHSFGNLFLAAMCGVAGDLKKAIQDCSRVLAVKGQVLPATMAQMTLVARYADGGIIRGESHITAQKRPITDIWCEPSALQALPEAIAAIEDADAIILGPGSLYTSLIPHLLIPDLRLALLSSRAPKIYICNVMTQPGETDGFTAADHVRVLQRYGGTELLSHVLVNEALPWRLLAKYESQGQVPVDLDWEALLQLGVEPVRGAFIDEDECVRHNSTMLASSLMTWLETLQPDSHRSRARTGPLPQSGLPTLQKGG